MLTAKRRSNPDNINSRLIKESAYETEIENPYKTDWICPLCDNEVLYVKEGVDGTTAHFRHRNSVNHPNISEGKRHNNVKLWLKSKFEQSNYYDVELEHIKEDQIADIGITTNTGEKIAVEIQCSTQGKQKFAERTESWNNKGYAVLWIIDFDNFMEEKQTGYVSGYNYRKSVKWLQKHYFGRIYGFYTEKKEFLDAKYPHKLILEARRCSQATAYVEKYIPGIGYDTQKRFYKTVCDFTTGNIPNYNLTTVPDSNGIAIARFYDQRWWDNDE